MLFAELWRRTTTRCRSRSTRLARRRPAPQGRGGHGGGHPEGGGGDLHPRPRHRLGRRRPRHPRRRAQGASRLAQRIAAPTTAWTSPPAPSWCRPTASRCWNAAPRSTPTISGAGHAPDPRRCARRARPTRARPRRRRSLPSRGLPRGGGLRLSLPCARPRHLRTASSISWPPAATRSRPTSATQDQADRRRHLPLTHPRFAQQYRLNVGTIVEARC